MVKLGFGAERQVENILLTRYIYYFIAQNGYPRKERINLDTVHSTSPLYLNFGISSTESSRAEAIR